MGSPGYINAKPNPKPGSRGYLKWYWVAGPGLAKWATSPHPWTTLKRHLRGKVPAPWLNDTVSSWFHFVFGIWPGERKGDNPVGPG